ncbi:hypothetical protein [Corynebacterium timonense]|uniref:Uncharacterized protein n=1 Tax=Corynebacterium timonense TaxID=441500 RepID=A0A1H1LMZ4_9CORY|nr:hypothetical protein [Corynebacterium timonense]SDR75908.1 hypothetical protein SAMN04488539_0278 [Corynebacterium timonense]
MTTTTQDYITANLDAFAQIERETGREFTDEQRTEIAQLALDGTDFYAAFDQVTSLTAEVTLAEQGHHSDLVQLRTHTGDLLETPASDGIGTEDGFYVEPSEDSAPYELAAEEWLRGLPGIWTITEWA